MDLRCPLLVDELERDLFSGMYKAFHVGTCCTTFSRACSQAYRSNEEPWGKQSETDPARRATCQLGNYLALVSLRLIIAALASGTTIVTWENPLCSMMWLLPPIKDLLMSGKLFRIRVDYCQYNRRFQKPTAFGSNCLELLAMSRLCNHRKRGLTHLLKLRGVDPRTGKPMTLRGNIYPPGLVRRWTALTHEAVKGK